MQLGAARRSPLRAQLGAAACALLAASAPAAARADEGMPTRHAPNLQLDLSTLYYGEQGRTQILEPAVRVTRLFANGQQLTAGVDFDAMTGASPTGGVASSSTQTTTSASGTTTSVPPSQLPTAPFRDHRAAADLGYTVPIGILGLTAGGHYSKEKDYRSAGVNGLFTLDLFQRTLELTGGGGVNHDEVNPVGGTVAGLSEGVVVSTSPNAKDVTSMMAGISRVMSRRWLAGVSATREVERGYLTEPYKILDVLDPLTLESVRQLHEQRPDLRTRTSVMLSSTYHFTQDVGYASYRWYGDDWGVMSHTLDFKYRHDLDDHHWIMPHVRGYAQSQADFFHYYLVDGQPLPSFASADGRLGPLRTLTLGATYGFQLPNAPGEWSIRAEYLRQWGAGQLTRAGTSAATPSAEDDASGTVSLFPGVNIGSVLVTYSIGF